MYLADDDRILDADEIAAELVPDAHDFFEQVFAAHSGTRPANTVRPRPQTPQPSAAGAHSAHGAHTLTTVSSELQNARLELARLHSQMRARDAYLVELEQALHAATRQLAASGIGTLDDAYRLLGRVRGQAFRIAELESELRGAKRAQAPNTQAAAPEPKSTLKPPKPRPKLPAARAVTATSPSARARVTDG
jgi:hypothetical protein